MAKPIARPIHRSGTTAGLPVRRVAAAAVVMAVVVTGAVLVSGRAPASSPSPRPAAVGPTELPGPSPTPAVRPTSTPRTASPTPRPSGTRQPAPTATARPTPSTGSAAAPSGAAAFDRQGQAIEIHFPLRPETRYRYRDNFLGVREGPPDDYNHSRVNEEGESVRLHDGIDIYGGAGEPLVAPFSGVVIDPGDRWSGWRDDRYGLVVVLVSDERGSTDYTAVMAHLDRVWVEVGQRVERGQILGVLGSSGNADGVHPHLHFELRAPFLIDWSPLGMDHQVDAFNPYPSLVRADQHRR